jgi:hypothetical protein
MRFTIRDVLWLTVVVALATFGAIEHSLRMRDQPILRNLARENEMLIRNHKELFAVNKVIGTQLTPQQIQAVRDHFKNHPDAANP